MKEGEIPEVDHKTLPEIKLIHVAPTVPAAIGAPPVPQRQAPAEQSASVSAAQLPAVSIAPPSTTAAASTPASRPVADGAAPHTAAAGHGWADGPDGRGLRHAAPPRLSPESSFGMHPNGSGPKAAYAAPELGGASPSYTQVLSVSAAAAQDGRGDGRRPAAASAQRDAAYVSRRACVGVRAGRRACVCVRASACVRVGVCGSACAGRSVRRGSGAECARVLRYRDGELRYRDACFDIRTGRGREDAVRLMHAGAAPSLARTGAGMGARECPREWGVWLVRVRGWARVRGRAPERACRGEWACEDGRAGGSARHPPPAHPSA